MVRTSRCGRDNPGSNPGSGVVLFVAHTPLHIALRWVLNVRTTSPARGSCVMGTGEQSRMRFINSVVIRIFGVNSK